MCKGLVSQVLAEGGLVERISRAAVGGYVGWLEGLLRKIPVPTRQPSEVDVLTLADVIYYFSEHHPGDPAVAGGALLRQPHPKGFLVVQVFLDSNKELYIDSHGRPSGQRLLVRAFDAELAAKFSTTDLIIFS